MSTRSVDFALEDGRNRRGPKETLEADRGTKYGKLAGHHRRFKTARRIADTVAQGKRGGGS